jgi:hypothetical protein
VEADDAIGVADVGGTAEQQPVGDAEHRGVGADAEGERHADEEGETGLAAETAERELDVLQK